jgi:hypothetical protein
MLYYTRGHVSAPLDDTLIYFQYAKQAAHGEIMRYQDGDPRTTGATGFAYPLVLALGYLAGFRGNGLFVFALGFNIIMLLVTVAMTFMLARHMMDERAAWLAAAFVAINGWLGWTFLAMMETGLHTVFLLALLYCYARAREGRGFLLGFLAMLALALLRPAGAGRFCAASWRGVQHRRQRFWRAGATGNTSRHRPRPRLRESAGSSRSCT